MKLTKEQMREYQKERRAKLKTPVEGCPECLKKDLLIKSLQIIL